jgi:thiosulfate reductase/polysulfide reductase chain A
MTIQDKTQQNESTDGCTGRRTALKAGILAAVGLGTGSIFHGFLSAADAAQATGARSAKRANRVTDPLVGELARADVDGYTGKEDVKRTAVPTSCLQCVAICGIIGYAEDDHIVKIEGNPHCLNNRGMICAKGQAAINQAYDPDRIIYPLVRTGKRREGKWKRIPRKDAVNLVVNGGEIAGRKVEGLKAIYESGKPEEFMFHYGRSRIKGAQNHFSKTAFGSKTMGNHTSICETAKWLGNELTMGKHYDINDVGNSKYILIFGANVLEAHTSHTFFAQRLIEAQRTGTKVVTFDVRLSNTAARSDEWVPIRPGTDLAVVLAMTNVILNEQPYGKPLYDEEFVSKWTNVTIDELREHYKRYTPEWAEKESGVPAETTHRIALEYGSSKPATIVTYRGFVGHYNGTYAEWAARTLDAVAGNFNVKGGTNLKVSGKCKDAYEEVAKKNKESTRKARGLKIMDGDGLHLPTHHSCQWIYEMIADGSKGRPKLYMNYCYNGAYTTGDCERNLEILCNEEYLPFIVAVDVAISETAECADLVLPDATFLERWTLESTQSMALIPFVQIRQPVAKPLGESMDIQDLFIQFAQGIGGDMAKLHPYKTADEYIEQCVRLQAKDNEKNGKNFYGVDGQPVTTDPWEYFKKYGVLAQDTKSHYHVHEKKLKEKDIAGKTVDEKTGTIWDPEKAHVKEEDVAAKGYTGSKNAYKGYVGQMIDGTAYKGFKPDKINKSGLFEVRSGFMTPAAEKVMGDIEPYLRPDESWVADHLAVGLPCWVPVPEHRAIKDNQLVMVSFKVNVQIHSRSQNCKWLQEIYHSNPAWIHPDTARRILGPDVKDGDVVRIKTDMAQLEVKQGSALPKAAHITTKLHFTQGIHPEAIAVSFHCGHWAYGRYASEKIETDLVEPEDRWWQCGNGCATTDPKKWSDCRGVHPNWIIPNTPARVSGQFRSNDTVVTLTKA